MVPGNKTDQSTEDFKAVSTTTEKPHIDVIVDNLPTASEDKMKTLLINGSTYGNGLAKPRTVTELLHHMNTTEYKETNNTQVVKLIESGGDLKINQNITKATTITLENEMPIKPEIKLDAAANASNSDLNKTEKSTNFNYTTKSAELSTETNKIISSTEPTSTTSTETIVLRSKKSVEEFERFGQVSKKFVDNYKHFMEDVATSNKRLEDFSSSIEKFANSYGRAKRAATKSNSNQFTEMVSVFTEEFKHFDENTPNKLNDRFLNFVESLNTISTLKKKRSLNKINSLNDLDVITNTFSTKLTKFNDDVLIAGNDFKEFMAALYKFSELKDLLKTKDLTNEQTEHLHKLTKVFENGFQTFNDEILRMGDHLVTIFGSVEKFSRMKRDISVVALNAESTTGKYLKY